MKKHTREVLEQYYTSPIFIEHCVDIIRRQINEWNELFWVDFSAGTNDFLRTLSPQFAKAFDIDPIDTTAVEKKDFLTVVREDVSVSAQDVAVCFNPPFGLRGALARRFVNHSLATFAPKYFVLLAPLQSWKQLDKLYEQMYVQTTPPNAFYRRSPVPQIFTFRVPFVILRRRPEQRQSTVASLPSLHIVQKRRLSDPNIDIEKWDMVVACAGDGSAGRNIFLKHSPYNWILYRDSREIQKMRNPRESKYKIRNNYAAFKFHPRVSMTQKKTCCPKATCKSTTIDLLFDAGMY